MGPLLRERDALRLQLDQLRLQAVPVWHHIGVISASVVAGGDHAKRWLLPAGTLALQAFPCDSRVAWAASGRLPSSNRGVSGFRNLSFASNDANVVPKWCHERIRQSSSGTPQPQASIRSQNAIAAVFRFAWCSFEYRGYSAASHVPACGPRQWDAVASDRGCTQVSEAAFGQTVSAVFASSCGQSLACDSTWYATAQGGAQRPLPMPQRQEGQAVPSGVDLNRDASRNVWGAL